MLAPPYLAIAAQKQKDRAFRLPPGWFLPFLPPPEVLDVRSIPLMCGILSAKEIHITSDYDATSLAAAICSRKLTSEEVAVAFCKRAAIAQQLVNCLTEIFFADGIERAKWLDAEFERTGRPVGPLHGVPVSLKDTFKVKGYDASIGIASLANSPAKENSPLVDILLGAGAVLYCKTNVPQTLQALDCDNHLFGRTLNPRNRVVTVGGSSGGEGALIAMHGSVLGVGTDLGGSIRIPAMCNGLYGIKPSVGRVPFAGQEGASRPGAGSVGLKASAGPIAATLRDCELFLKVVADARPWERDPDVLFGAWEEQSRMSSWPLIGVVRTDGLVTPLPPVAKVIEETVQALKRSGYDVVEMDMPLFKKCQSLANRFFGIEGGNYMFGLLEKTGEPLVNWLKTRLRRKNPMDVEAVAKLFGDKTALETEMLQIWRDPKTGRRVDAFICPVAPHPVPPIDRWNAISYTLSMVLLDYPAGVLPVRDFEETDLEGYIEGEPLNSWDKVNRELCKRPPDAKD
jgi:amidase